MYSELFAWLSLVAIGFAVLAAWNIIDVYVKKKKDINLHEGEEEWPLPDLGRTLIVYYSLGGKTRRLAQEIASITGGKLYEILPEREIKKAPFVYFSSRKYLNGGGYPPIVADLPDPNYYDTIFVGSPIWWGKAAWPVAAYLEKTDFQGKKVIPFCTVRSDYGSFFDDFEKKAKNAKILEGEYFYNHSRKYDYVVRNKIRLWLSILEK